MEFLNQPHPYFHRGKDLLHTALLILLIGFAVEYLIEPFQRDYDEHLYNYFIISLAHVGVAMVAYLAYFVIFNLLARTEDWTMKKEFYAILGLLFCIGVGEFFVRYLIYADQSGIGWSQFMDEISHAYLVGSVLFFIIMNIKTQHLTWKTRKEAEQILPRKPQQQLVEEIQIVTSQPSDDFELNPDKLLCVKSNGNYCEFFMDEEQGVEKLLKRVSLQKTEEQLRPYSFFQKTHRAHIVNINKVDQVSGNAAGYQLTLSSLPFKVPVSRSNLEAFNLVMQ